MTVEVAGLIGGGQTKRSAIWKRWESHMQAIPIPTLSPIPPLHSRQLLHPLLQWPICLHLLFHSFTHPTLLVTFLLHYDQSLLKSRKKTDTRRVFENLCSLSVWSFACEVPLDSLSSSRVNRVRSFPHVEGNYALHVYIPGNFIYLPNLGSISASSNFIFVNWAKSRIT